MYLSAGTTGIRIWQGEPELESALDDGLDGSNCSFDSPIFFSLFFCPGSECICGSFSHFSYVLLLFNMFSFCEQLSDSGFFSARSFPLISDQHSLLYTLFTPSESP
jgi:hypothetical protein